MGNWQQWSDWLIEGYYLSFIRENTRIYEHIIGRDLAHYQYNWPEIVLPLQMSGPFTPDQLEVTKGYSTTTNTNRIWQMIFGIQSQAYIYIELPTDIHRHGIPKVPKPGTDLREVSHFEEWMSPFMEPSFLTEHIMLRPETERISFEAYNPGTIPFYQIKLNIFIAKLTTERIGTEQAGVLTPTSTRWRETLDKLYRRVIPHRPLTILPVRAPAEAPAGE